MSLALLLSFLSLSCTINGNNWWNYIFVIHSFPNAPPLSPSSPLFHQTILPLNPHPPGASAGRETRVRGGLSPGRVLSVRCFQPHGCGDAAPPPPAICKKKAVRAREVCLHFRYVKWLWYPQKFAILYSTMIKLVSLEHTQKWNSF